VHQKILTLRRKGEFPEIVKYFSSFYIQQIMSVFYSRCVNSYSAPLGVCHNQAEFTHSYEKRLFVVFLTNTDDGTIPETCSGVGWNF
jgi:hypothetical protein